MTTQELTQAAIETKARIAALQEKVDEACLRLGVVEREVKEQGKLLQSIDRLAMGITRLDEKITELGDKVDVFGGRINVLELEPGVKWKSLAMDVIKFIVLAGAGFAAAKLF